MGKMFSEYFVTIPTLIWRNLRKSGVFSLGKYRKLRCQDADTPIQIQLEAVIK
jgi:hypothetical protein